MFLITVTVSRKLYFESFQQDKPLPELSFLCVNISYRLWRFDEDFGLAQLELVLVHVDRVQEVQDSLSLFAPPLRPGVLCQDGIPAAHRPVLACSKQQDSLRDLTL